MMSQLTRLQRVVDALALGREVFPADARWMAEAVVGLSADPNAKLDTVLGLPATWRRDLRHARRDDRLRRLAADLPGPTAAKAAALQAMLRDYQSNGWLRERHLAELPSGASARRRLLHEIMTLDINPPTSSRRLFDILSDCSILPIVIADEAEDTGHSSE